MHWNARNLPPADRDEERAILRRPGARHLTTLALYWIDGRCSLSDVADLVEAEDGRRDVEALVRYAALPEAGGILEVVGHGS